MLKSVVKIIPERYRMLFFLVTTSCIGVGLILVAVFNASKELEIIHEIDNMNHFARAQLSEVDTHNNNYRDLLPLSDPSYQVLVIHNDTVLADTHGNSVSGWRYQPSELSASRVNENGGYIETDERAMTWALIPLETEDVQLIIFHHFSSDGVAGFIDIYIKHLMIPALFYVWLMVWMGYIVRFLTHKLSEQKKAMEHMALHDTLTGLPNRNMLDDRLNRMLAMAKRNHSAFSIVMIDLDGFKNVNDTHGHAIGDELLKEVASRLDACLRPSDTVFRLGGDEFILVLDDINDGSSIGICERISTKISEPMTIQGRQMVIGSSMGIAKYSDQRDGPEDLIQKADQAMYEAKASGGGMRIYAKDLIVEGNNYMEQTDVA